MAKPTVSTEWANDGAALKAQPDGAQQNFGWSTSDNTINGTPVKPNLQNQNGWQNNVHLWLNYLEGRTDPTPVYVAASNSDSEDISLAAFQCDGTDDDVTIREALDAAGSAGVVLLTGAYQFGATLTMTDGDKLVGLSGSQTGNPGVRIVPGVSTVVFLAFDLSDGAHVENITLNSAAGSARINKAASISGDGCTFKDILIRSTAIRLDLEFAPLYAISLEGTNHYVTCNFLSGAVLNDRPENVVGLFVGAGVSGCYVNLLCEGDSFSGSGTNPDFDKASAILLDGALTGKNDLNTSWINLTAVAPTPPTSPPTGFAYDAYKYKWESGNVSLDLGFGWTTGNATTIDIPVPVPLRLNIQNNARGGFYTIPAGPLTTGDTAAPWDVTPIYMLWLESGLGFRVSNGTATPVIYSDIGNGKRTTTLGGCQFMISK